MRAVSVRMLLPWRRWNLQIMRLSKWNPLCECCLSYGKQQWTTYLRSQNYPSSVYGINEDYLSIRKYSIEEGDMFTEQDILSSAKVCVIGKTIVDNLFTGGESPAGKVIRFNKIPFKVVGVLVERIQQYGNGSGQSDVGSLYNRSKESWQLRTCLGITASALKRRVYRTSDCGIEDLLRHNHSYNWRTTTISISVAAG